MAKTSFELEFEAKTLKAAVVIAEGWISAFLGIDLEDVPNAVDLELKVKSPEESSDKFKVTAFASVKRNQNRPA
jgi:hypothetical protein